MSKVKKFLFAIAVLVIAALTSISANASLLIEPHLDYNLGSKTTYQGSEYKYSGPEYGAHLGVQFVGLMGGVAYTYSTYTFKQTTGAVTASAKVKKEDTGVFIGYTAPLMLRAWLAYYFLTKQTQKDGAGVGDYYKGHTTEIGVGFTPLPLISINLSYKMLSYNKLHDAGTGVDSTIAPKFEPKEILLGVSLPITLL